MSLLFGHLRIDDPIVDGQASTTATEHPKQLSKDYADTQAMLLFVDGDANNASPPPFSQMLTQALHTISHGSHLHLVQRI